MNQPYANFPDFGIFRVDGMWVLAWGYLAGANTLDPRVEVRLSDEGLRRLYGELQRVIAAGRTHDNERFSIPLLEPPAMVTWEGLLEMHGYVERRIHQLDSGEPIRESETYQTGGPN